MSDPHDSPSRPTAERPGTSREEAGGAATAPRPRLGHRAELALFLAVRGLVGHLPPTAARRAGAALGQLLWIGGVRRRTTLGNLALAFPELSPAERRRLAARCFRHFGAMACDTIVTSRVDPVEFCRRLTIHGWEHLDAAEAQGRGVLVFGGHTGNWEIAARALGLYRTPYHIVVRPFNNPFVYSYMARDRERFGIREVNKRGAARQLFRVLREGGRVGLAMDQRVRRGQGGIEVPFFGHPALATPLPASMALRTGAPAVPIFAWPEPRGHYRIDVHPAIQPETTATGDAAVAELTGRFLAVLEREIRGRPEQWLWQHRRWRLD
jgi:KDO2-lipid IV(A) lauroyltransferase